MSRGLNLTKAQREQVEAAEAVFAPWGLEVELGKDGPHPHLKVRAPADQPWAKRFRGEYKLTIAGTPKNVGDSVSYARQGARRLVERMMRDAGVL